MTPILRRVLRAEGWQQREQALVTAYERLAGMHNGLGLTDPASTEATRL